MSQFDKIRTAVINKGYLFFDNGDYNLNCIWERTSDTITNYFTDFFHLLYYINKVPQIITIPATTKPGIKGSIDSPITYEGITGTAIIIPNQYRGTWQFTEGLKGSHYPWTAPHFRQIKGISYWRDGDKDLVVDHEQEQDNKVFGTHWHNMSQPGASGFQVNNWSLGCMGWQQPDSNKILPIVRQSIKLYEDKFTGTIIESNDLDR